MSVYCTTTIDGTEYKLSTELLIETDIWEPSVIAIKQITSSMDKEYGGHLKPVYGNIEFIPTLFEDFTTPPDTIIQKIETGISDSAKVLLCESNCILKSFDRNSVIYSAIGKGESITNENKVFTSGTTLKEVFEWGCIELGYTLNVDGTITSTTITVDHTNASKRLVLDMLSEAAASFLHYFYILDNVIYLMDLNFNPSSISLTEYDFLPASYFGGDHISLLKTNDDVSIDGNNPDGKEISVAIWKTVESEIQNAMQDILNHLEKKCFSLKIANTDTSIAMGCEVYLLDQSTIQNTLGLFTVTKKNLNFSSNTDSLIIEGRGILL